MSEFQGQVVIVTGAASGIGAACAARFLSAGARVVLADLKAPAAGQPQGSGERQRYIRHDVSSEASWQALFGCMQTDWGAPDVLVNCAGVMNPGDIETTSLEMFQQAMAVNAGGVFLGCQHAVKAMRAAGKRGAIVNVASTTAIKPAQWVLAYAASKAAVVSLTRTVALHCARSGYGIRCNAVLPGSVRTENASWQIRQQKDPAVFEKLARWYPLGRVAEPDDVAKAVSFLASDDASYITGVALPVDGGLLAGMNVMIGEFILE